MAVSTPVVTPTSAPLDVLDFEVPDRLDMIRDDDGLRPERRLRVESWSVALTVATIYGAIAWVLDFKYHVYPPDAVSRMANGFYVLYSRHPHIAAIGFVWNPLQSLLDIIPLLAWKLWPAVASHDAAGSLVSAAAMVAAVHQLRATLFEVGVRRTHRLLLVALFALNPMILYYAANGMSEALYLFLALATCRYLLRWFRDGELRSLSYAAVALGLCYLARNEAVGIAIAAGAVVCATTLRRAVGPTRTRVLASVTDGTIFALPFVAAFTGWALAGYVITGQPFQQFTSQYGNKSELALFGSQYGNHGAQIARLAHEATDISSMAPLLPVALILALAVALRRRDGQIAVPLSVLGGGLAFIMLSYLENQVFPWYRFYILSIPLEVLAVGSVLAAAPLGSRVRIGANDRSSAPPRGSWATRPHPIVTGALGVAVIIAIVGPSLPATAAGMFNRKVGIEESFQIGFVVHEAGTETAAERAAAVPMLPYIEDLHLRDGSIVTDEDLHGCVTTMIIRSTNPKVFVIPNDTDFQRVLADPLTFHADYVLVPQPAGFDSVNSVVRAYPSLYDNGAGFARLVRSFPASVGLCPPYRLYRVYGHPSNPEF